MISININPFDSLHILPIPSLRVKCETLRQSTLFNPFYLVIPSFPSSVVIFVWRQEKNGKNHTYHYHDSFVIFFEATEWTEKNLLQIPIPDFFFLSYPHILAIRSVGVVNEPLDLRQSTLTE